MIKYFQKGYFVKNLLFLLILFVCSCSVKEVKTPNHKGIICLGRNMSKVLEKTSVQVNNSKIFDNPRGEFKKIISDLDITKEHIVKVLTQIQSS